MFGDADFDKFGWCLIITNNFGQDNFLWTLIFDLWWRWGGIVLDCITNHLGQGHFWQLNFFLNFEWLFWSFSNFTTMMLLMMTTIAMLCLTSELSSKQKLSTFCILESLPGFHLSECDLHPRRHRDEDYN